MNDLSLIKTKQQIESYADSYIEKFIDEGENNNLELAVFLKKLSIFVDRITSHKYYKDFIISKVDKQEEVLGSNVIKQSRTTYDYSNCNHARWNELNKKKVEIDKELKTIEELLKKLKEPIADVNTGEVINPPDVKTYSEFLKIELK